MSKNQATKQPQPLYKPRSTHTPPNTVRGVLNTNLVVVIAPGKRPASIPNLEAKPGSANGTATARLWESRTPPQHTSEAARNLRVSGRSFYTLNRSAMRSVPRVIHIIDAALGGHLVHRGTAFYPFCRRIGDSGICTCLPGPCLVSVLHPHAVACPPDEKTHVTDQRRPQNGMSRAMLFPWSLLHINQTRPTDTVGRTRFLLNVWRPMIASLISPRLCSGSDRCFCPSGRAPTA